MQMQTTLNTAGHGASLIFTKHRSAWLLDLIRYFHIGRHIDYGHISFLDQIYEVMRRSDIAAIGLFYTVTLD